MTLVKFNCNNSVWVKLTDHGRQILEQQDYELLQRFPLKENEDGFSQWQLWSLMRHFGAHMGMAEPNCFDLDILIEI